MPAVDVFNRVNVGMSDDVSDSIKMSVRRIGTAHFSVSGLLLTEQDFSFKFYRPEKSDELTNDIIIRIRLHNFEERRETITDLFSGNTAAYVAEDLAKFFPTREITVGVELMLAEVMWGTATTMD